MSDLGNPEETKKRVLIQLRTTKEEKRKLRDHARTAGMNITDFVKARTLDKPPRTHVANYDREVLIKLLSELGIIGSNVTQMAKVMSEKEGFYSVTIKESVIMKTLTDISDLSNQILNELNRDHTGPDEG